MTQDFPHLRNVATGWRHGISLAAGLLLATLIGCDEPSDVSTTAVDTDSTTQTIDENDTVNADQSDTAESDTNESDTNESDTNESDTNESDAAESDAAEQFADAPEGKVLRHAVFFSFKDSSSDEEIQGVVDAFAALPSKVDEITDFQWGTNNSPEGLDDGFSHCFLLTFKDEAGRAAYLPHPAHKGEFADTLRPHMKNVFVIDYWGTTSETEIKKPLQHAVFFKFKDDADPADVKEVEEAFAALPSKIDSIKAFEWGTNNSPETHDDGFTHCFLVTFDSEEGRQQYLPHEDHLAFVKLLTPVLDKVRVLDFQVGK